MFLSSYDIMWVMVMFDLPVLTPIERKAATSFRNFLLDEGFYMGQFSVYFKVMSGKDALRSLQNKISSNLPPSGKVDVISITDRQYEDIVSYEGNESAKKQERGSQLNLF